MKKLFLVLPLVAALAVPALAGDIILKKDGKTSPKSDASVPPKADDYDASNITVTQENLDGIVFRIDGVATPQRMKADDVDTVFHDPSTIPSGLRKGKAFFEAGQWADARAELDGIRGADWALAEAAFHAAASFYWEGALDEANDSLAKFRSDYPKSRFVPRATTLSARSMLEAGDIAGAKAAFEAMKKIPGIPEADQIEADYWIAWISEQVAAKNNNKSGTEAALKAYEALSRAVKGRAGMEDVGGKATIGQASCLLTLGRYGDAKKLVTKIADSAEEPTVLAGAYTMLGRSIVLETAGKSDTVATKEALYHFLRVVTLYGNTPGAEDYMAESLYRAGDAFNELRPTNPQSDEQKEDSRNKRMRAIREWNECIQRYPRSEWAAKARASKNSN